MKNRTSFFYLMLLVAFHVYGVEDADFDGVDDAIDKCPNTPFSDLADAYGCTTSSLYTPTSYDIIMGLNLSSMNANTLENTKTSNATLQADIYHGNFSAQFLTSYFKSQDSTYSDSGWNDSQINLFYLFKPTTEFMFQAGVGVIAPTYSTGYSNEAADYLASLSLQYSLDKNIHLFGGYSYTMVNDNDVENLLNYQNTNAFYAGIRYIGSKNKSISASYTNSQSIYSGVKPIETLSVGVMLPLDSHWFLLGDYRYGISDSASDHEAALRVGYTF
jgi:hypothetical protein